MSEDIYYLTTDFEATMASAGGSGEPEKGYHQNIERDASAELLSSRKEDDDDDHPHKTKIVPQLASHNISFQDLQIAIKVLDAIGQLHPNYDHNSKKIQTKKKRRNSCAGSDHDIEKFKSTTQNDNNINDTLSMYQHPNLRPLRKALALSFEVHKLILFHGKSEEKFKEYFKEKRLKAIKNNKIRKDSQFLAATLLRRGRLEKLKQLQRHLMEVEMDKITARSNEEMDQLLQEEKSSQGFLVEERALKRKNMSEKVFDMMIPDGPVETQGIDIENFTQEETYYTSKRRICHICDLPFHKLHLFYDKLCPVCAQLNFSKRHQSADLTKKIAVVTGARVKIGFQVCLKLLRAGCTVIATTRFPNTAVENYRKEADFNSWKDRLCVYGLDFRDVIGLEAFTHFLKLQYGDVGIDILINNACQTVRRPAGYYSLVFEKEQTIWKEADHVHKQILHGCVNFEKVRRQLNLNHQQNFSGAMASLPKALYQDKSEKINVPFLVDEATKDQVQMEAKLDTHDDAVMTSTEYDQNVPTTAFTFEESGLSTSAVMSKMVVLPEDVGVCKEYFPPGMVDINGQQLDLRKENSWVLTMSEVSTPELIECMFINAIAPFVLNARLKPLMTCPDDNSKRPDRYIINVSSMEGKFSYRLKTHCHPHTNMAKAALNMLTRTTSADLAKNHRIYQNSIDTGWINDQNPLKKARTRCEKEHMFQPPLDEIDAAARILDLIFTGINNANNSEKQYGGGESKNVYGKFFKNYRETDW